MKNIIIFLFIIAQFTLNSTAQSIAQWRGTDRNGVYNETNLLKTWPAKGPQLMWVTEGIGAGFGSPVVTSDRIYVTGEIDSVGYLSALDFKGNLLWKSEYGREYVKNYPGSRSTPTVVGDLIYVCSGLGDLYCLDAKTGSKKWFVELKKDFNGDLRLSGYSESPLVDDDKVFLIPGGPVKNVVALNRFTGKIIWTSKAKGEVTAYNSPILIKLPQQRDLLVTFTGQSMLGMDAKTGELLWVHAQYNNPEEYLKLKAGAMHANSGWYENGFIYYIEGGGNGAVKLALSNDGKQIKELWRNKTINNSMCGFIKLGDKIYSSNTKKKDLKCIDAITGQISDSLQVGNGNIILADKMLYYYNQKGEVHLIKPTPEKLELVSTFKITKGTLGHYAHPVINNGVFYIRHGMALMAYNIKE